MFIRLFELHGFYCTFLFLFFFVFTFIHELNNNTRGPARYHVHGYTNDVKYRRGKRVFNFYDICVLCIRVMMIVIISKNEGTLYTINLSQMEIITFIQPSFFFF